MQDCCGSCKYASYNENYIYPFKCLKDKARRYSDEEFYSRIVTGYKCENFVFGLAEQEEKYDR